MKCLLLFILLFSSLLFSKIPKDIEQKLCQQLAQDGSFSNLCENGSRLEYVTHSLTRDDKILLFLYLNEQSDTPHVSSITQVPVLIDKQGKWSVVKGKNEIQEWIQSITEDPHHALWINALWVVEGASSALYYSKDGSSIQEIVLPKSQEANGYYQGMKKPCFQKNHLVLNFDAFYNYPTQSWQATYQSAVSKHPHWVKRSNAQKNCLQSSKKTNWKQIENPNEMIFLHSRTHQTIQIPRTSKEHDNFYIQIGAYQDRQHALKVEKALGYNTIYYTTITKAKVHEKEYYRLRIGAFSSLEKAKIILKKISTNYKDSFIVRIKNK